MMLCLGCRRPILPADRSRPAYEARRVLPSVCGAMTSDADAKERFRERQRQIALAEARGERHIRIVHEG